MDAGLFREADGPTALRKPFLNLCGFGVPFRRLFFFILGAEQSRLQKQI